MTLKDAIQKREVLEEKIASLKESLAFFGAWNENRQHLRAYIGLQQGTCEAFEIPVDTALAKTMFDAALAIAEKDAAELAAKITAAEAALKA